MRLPGRAILAVIDVQREPFEELTPVCRGGQLQRSVNTPVDGAPLLCPKVLEHFFS
jgi:hypothetical protein